MKYTIIGAAGFIGSNLILNLSKDCNSNINAVDQDLNYFNFFQRKNHLKNVKYFESSFSDKKDFNVFIKGSDVVFHLLSTNAPVTSNTDVSLEINKNIEITTNILDTCVKYKVKKIVFISSGGAIYGKDVACPIKESDSTNPISSYGIQKLVIEKILYLYKYLYSLDYVTVRLSNPYGPYQRPGKLGVITNFVNKTLLNEPIVVYGNGQVIRDYIYIDDAVKAIFNLTFNNTKQDVYNIGTGVGTSIDDIIDRIKNVIDVKVRVKYVNARKVDVPKNVLNVSAYEAEFGKIQNVKLEDGILLTYKFLKENLQ